MKLQNLGLLAVGLFSCGITQAATTTTADLVDVVAGAPGSGTWTYSVGGWDGGGVVTGSFFGVDTDSNGQLSSFDGELSGFTMSYSGGTVVGPLGFDIKDFGIDDFFGLVYDLDDEPLLGDGLLLDIEGMGASFGAYRFIIGPGGYDLCGTGVPCGEIEGPSAAVPEPGTLALLGLGLLGLGVSRRKA